jgi:predicted O-methyltransferase YrrM
LSEPLTKPDPYSSHLLLLRSLLRTARPERVLEFGAGLYSTPCFLERPELKRIVSVEADPEWRKKVAHHCDDSRLVLRPDKRVLPDAFDLIFIDDGGSAAERLDTIRFVLSQTHPTTVIHDAEVPEYAAAIKELAITYSIYDATLPATAVVWE